MKEFSCYTICFYVQNFRGDATGSHSAVPFTTLYLITHVVCVLQYSAMYFINYRNKNKIFELFKIPTKLIIFLFIYLNKQETGLSGLPLNTSLILLQNPGKPSLTLYVNSASSVLIVFALPAYATHKGVQENNRCQGPLKQRSY